MNYRLILTLVLLIASPFAVLAGEIVGSVSAVNRVTLSGPGGTMAVPTGLQETVVAGDTLSTVGPESWAEVRLGRDGVMQLAPDSSARIDQVDDLFRIQLLGGGLRFALGNDQKVVIEAAESLLISGEHSGASMVAVSGGHTAMGSVVLDQGDVLVRNDLGAMRHVDPDGETLAIDAGQLLAFHDGAAIASATLAQIGRADEEEDDCDEDADGTRDDENCKGMMRNEGRWASLSPQAKALIIIGGLGALYLIDREIIDDDDDQAAPIASPF